MYQTNLVLEARKVTIDTEVLTLTELGEPIRKIEWKTVYEDSLKTANQFSLLTSSFMPAENLRCKDCLPTFRKTFEVFIKIKETILTSIEERFQAVIRLTISSGFLVLN